MVDTVLTRDKNWVRWKADGCPPISRPAVSIKDYIDTRTKTTNATTNKPLRATLGSVNLSFLTEDANVNDLDRLKQPERYVETWFGEHNTLLNYRQVYDAQS